MLMLITIVLAADQPDQFISKLSRAKYVYYFQFLDFTSLSWIEAMKQVMSFQISLTHHISAFSSHVSQEVDKLYQWFQQRNLELISKR